MARFDQSNVNPDLARERQKATFDPEMITVMLDGGDFLTKRRRDIEALVLENKELTGGPDVHYLSRPELYSESVRKASVFLRALKEEGLDGRADGYFYGNLAFPNETPPIALHTAMFIPTIESQGTQEQKNKWLPKAATYEIIGTFAQTELGHGTNVRGLETTAIYDPKTQEFVLHSPTVSASKWWPGGLGKTTNFAVVIATLYTLGQCHGTHSFIVQLRDLNTHQPLPGITLGDIGPKFGFNTIDNGFLRLNQVRIPRENMLMKHAQVLPNGQYVKPAKNDKLGYGTMVFIRAMVVLDQGARGLAQAVTIATRYSCVRRQSELKPGEPEPQVLDYQTQQYKLFPQLAAAYAYWFSGLKMRETYFLLNYDIQHGNTELLPVLHATSSGLKALSSDGATVGIEQCRLACGGHGYSQSSGLPKIYTQTTAACTYEGENTVLYLQTARYLVKAYHQSRQHGAQPLPGSVSYLFEKLPEKCRIAQSACVDSLIESYKHRAIRMIAKACNRIIRLESSGLEAYDA
jgi:acyl-CoA oxidase